MAMFHITTVFNFLALFFGESEASAFLRPSAAKSAAPLSAEFEHTLLAEIEAALGADHRRGTENRLDRIETALRQTFAALPKNEYGKLGRSAARYALHRVFLERHGWFVRGIEPNGEEWNSSSPTAVLNDRVPEHVQDLFEQRIGGHGFSLHEMAVLAATLEHLVQVESMNRLQVAYDALGVSMDLQMDETGALEIIDTYMATYITGLNVSGLRPEIVRKQVARANEIYPTWDDTKVFLREVKQSVAPETMGLGFESVSAVVQEVGERYGRWQAAECRDLKNQLMTYEDAGTGRVRIGDFYGAALNDGQWQFSESVEYLRELGALDDSDPSNLRVLIPNYINGPSNCIAPSRFHAVCCLDECEELISHLEKEIAAPTAKTDEIIRLVSALPSATVSGNRTLSSGLRRRLDDIAVHHNGDIPLHGRLFSQWMHYAYPRECPYPHVIGTVKPKRSDDWESSGERASVATKDEMRDHFNLVKEKPTAQPADDDEVCSAWTMEEELVVPQAAPLPRERKAGGLGSTMRSLAFVASLGTSAIAIIKTMTQAKTAGTDSDFYKQCV
jgi:hypothetical protein